MGGTLVGKRTVERGLLITRSTVLWFSVSPRPSQGSVPVLFAGIILFGRVRVFAIGVVRLAVVAGLPPTVALMRASDDGKLGAV